MSRMNELSSYKTTWLHKDNGFEVVYQNTKIVDVTTDHIKLDTGGWFTVTTKRKMNQAANQFGMSYCVYQRKGNWYVDYKGKTYDFSSDSIVLER